MGVHAATVMTRNGIGNREQRIRNRLDVVRDERDAALDELWKAREEIDKLEVRVDRQHGAVYEARRSRDMWRERAKAAEEMLAKQRRDRRKGSPH